MGSPSPPPATAASSDRPMLFLILVVVAAVVASVIVGYLGYSGALGGGFPGQSHPPPPPKGQGGITLPRAGVPAHEAAGGSWAFLAGTPEWSTGVAPR